MMTQPRIPFVDLAAAHAEISAEAFLSLDQLVKDSDFIGGKRLEHFEREFTKFCGAEAIGVSNGTDAIALALRAFGVGDGDEVITAANTFIATVEAISQAGATPVLVDVAPETALLDLDKLKAAITARTRAIVPVHLYGNPADLDALTTLCSQKKLLLIQDAAQAHGALWAGKPLGAFGDAQTYSFFPGKNLGAWGDAGLVATNNAEAASRIRALRNHGRLPAEKYTHHVAGGGNFRLDPLQATVLSIKLQRLAEKTSRRQKLAEKYRDRLGTIGDLRFFRPETKGTAVYHLFVVRTARRDALKKHLEDKGISTGVHYPVPVHLQPALSSLGLSPGAFPEAELQAREVLSLPFYPEMPEEHLERVCAEVRAFFS